MCGRLCGGGCGFSYYCLNNEILLGFGIYFPPVFAAGGKILAGKEWGTLTFDGLGLHEIVRHNFDPGARFCVLHGSGEILQDQAARRGGKAALERLQVLAAAATNVHEQHAILALFGATVTVEDLLLHREPVSEDGTVLAAGCHEGIEVSGSLGILFDEVPEAKVGAAAVLDGCSEGIGGASIAIFLEIGGHFGEVLEGVVEAEDRLSFQ